MNTRIDPLTRTPRPSYYFTSECDGMLYDTRKLDWSTKPLRSVYSRHYRQIETGNQLRATLRSGEYAWPGGYQLYFVASDGAALSFASVRKNLRRILEAVRDQDRSGWRVVATACTAEDEDLVICADSGEVIFDPEG